jgi:hypothetical protein
VFDTRFLIEWPEHLGGGLMNIDLAGSMVLTPLLASS